MKQFVEGEGFAYLGRNYRLTLTTRPPNQGRRPPRSEAASTSPLPRSPPRQPPLMRRWYTDTSDA